MNFTDISPTIGFFQDNQDAHRAYFGDIDNDGDLDAFVSDRDGNMKTQRNYLHRNDNGSFVDVADAKGIKMNSFAWGTSFLDADQDEFIDLFVNSSMDGMATFLSSAFYHQ